MLNKRRGDAGAHLTVTTTGTDGSPPDAPPTVLSGRQKIVLVVALAVLIACGIVAPIGTLIVVNGVLVVLITLASVLKLFLLRRAIIEPEALSQPGLRCASARRRGSPDVHDPAPRVPRSGRAAAARLRDRAPRLSRESSRREAAPRRGRHRDAGDGGIDAAPRVLRARRRPRRRAHGQAAGVQLRPRPAPRASYSSSTTPRTVPSPISSGTSVAAFASAPAQRRGVPAGAS